MEQDSPSIFFVISGEHPTLPRAELKAILESMGATFELSNSDYKVVEVRAPTVIPSEVARKAGYTEEAGLKIFSSSPTFESIATELDSSPISDYLSPKERFSVRVARFGGGRLHGQQRDRGRHRAAGGACLSRDGLAGDGVQPAPRPAGRPGAHQVGRKHRL